MTSDGRTGTVVASTLPVVEAFTPARRELTAFGQRGGGRRKVVNDPVDPGGLGRLRIGRIRIVDDEREAPGRLGRALPGEGWRPIGALTGVGARDLGVAGESGRGQLHRAPPIRAVRLLAPTIAAESAASANAIAAAPPKSERRPRPARSRSGVIPNAARPYPTW